MNSYPRKWVGNLFQGWAGMTHFNSEVSCQVLGSASLYHSPRTSQKICTHCIASSNKTNETEQTNCKRAITAPTGISPFLWIVDNIHALDVVATP